MRKYTVKGRCVLNSGGVTIADCYNTESAITIAKALNGAGPLPEQLIYLAGKRGTLTVEDVKMPVIVNSSLFDVETINVGTINDPRASIPGRSENRIEVVPTGPALWTTTEVDVTERDDDSYDEPWDMED